MQNGAAQTEVGLFWGVNPRVQIEQGQNCIAYAHSDVKAANIKGEEKNGRQPWDVSVGALEEVL